MDIFRRLTNPTLKKLYRFVLKRLVGRFLDDDIALEQLDVQLGAGRIELTDLNINVRAVAELLPNLPFRFVRAHVGRLRVEISYAKLLTESLAFYLDDIYIEIAPPFEDDTDTGTHRSDVGAAPFEHEAKGPLSAGIMGNKSRFLDRRNQAEEAASKAKGAESVPCRKVQMGDTGEGLDFVAQWIEQITSKVKVVVQSLTVRVASAARLEGASHTAHDDERSPFVDIRCSSLRWCDETPESSMLVPEGARGPHSTAPNATRLDNTRKPVPGAGFTQKRLTLGVVAAEWNGGGRREKREVMKMGGTGCIGIKHDRRPPLGSMPADAVLDIDVSLRHAGVTLGVDDCAGLCTLLSAYLTRVEGPVADVAEDLSVISDSPARDLFREDFWYFDGLPSAGETHSGELNFDTLSGLLEQYADARARLAEAGGYGQGVLGGGSRSSLGQSDVFYDCEDGVEDGVGGNGAYGRNKETGTDHHDDAKVRVRMTGLDITLLLSNGTLNGSSNCASASHIGVQMRRISQTLHFSEGWMQSVTEVGTFIADFADRDAGGCRRVPVVEVFGAAGASPCLQMTCSSGGGVDTDAENTSVNGAGGIAVDLQCLPVAAVVDTRLVGLLCEFITQVLPQAGQVQPVVSTDDGGGNGRSMDVASSGKVRDRRIRVVVAVPKLTVRFPADPGACSSAAYTALISSVQNGTSPVGWAPREAPEQLSPALVLEIESATVTVAVGAPKTPTATLDCTRIACQMLLVCSNGNSSDEGGDLMGLYFLEASRVDTPLKVEYGLAEDMGKAGNLGAARPADADLKFLHTWEPNDGVDGSLGEVPSTASYGRGRHGDEVDSTDGHSSSHKILLCHLPRLGVELSRLELVVLADILAGLSPTPTDASVCVPLAGDPQCLHQENEAPTGALEVLVEARGATIVLHEAAAFAEDPGPHSYVLNLGNACLHLGGSEICVDGHAAPMVTVSSGDVCVHETLRRPREERSSVPGRRQITEPLIFLPGRNVSAYPSVEDLSTLGLIPVLYQTKWAKGTSPVAAELALAVSGSGEMHKTITAKLNLYDVSLRHTVTSSWLPRLLGLVVGDVPAGRGGSVNSSQTGVDINSGIGESGGNLTKMFITVFNGAVDYMPQSQGKPGGATGIPLGESPATEGRAVFPIGVLRVSSNMVAGAPVQGFKVVIRDIGLHMSNRAMDYCSEDAGLCRGALDTQRLQDLPFAKTELSSVQEFLETSQFVQIATLNFLDAFLRTRSQVVAPPDAFTAVELWMGIVHVYTCHDSLSTCQSLLGEWWALVNECRTATVDLGKAAVRGPKRHAGHSARDEGEASAPTSLLDDVEQDAFLPGNSTEPPSQANTGADTTGSISGDQYPSLESRKQRSLVIEDYYRVSVEPPDARAAAPVSFVLDDALGGDSRRGLHQVDSPAPGHDSSFMSEDGPAQWLASPQTGLDHTENLSMELAEDTSESDGEEGTLSGAEMVDYLPVQPSVVRRSTYGFSLPAPIEIELEVRHDADRADATESGKLSPSTTADKKDIWPERMELRPRSASSLDDASCHSHAEDMSPSKDASGHRGVAGQDEAAAPTQGVEIDADGLLMPEVLSRHDSLPFEEREGVTGQVESMPPGETSDYAMHGAQSTQLDSPVKTEPLHGDQEARWLGRGGEVENESNGAADVGNTAPSPQSEEFRVYPHYIPIPTTAESTSLLVSGDPLLALGHGLGKKADGEAVIEGSELVDQKLQFQLAIHDLSICWRLFKGRDWVERSTSDQYRASRQGSGDVKGPRQSRVVGRAASSGVVGDGKNRFPERRRDNVDSSSTTSGGPKPRKAELLDALLENYQDERVGCREVQAGRRVSRQPKLKLLNQPRETGATRSARRSGRDTSCMVEIILEHCSLRLDSFHPGPAPSLLSNLLFSIKDLHASDTLTSSRPRKTLQHWRDDIRHPREFQQKLVTVRMTSRSPSDHFCPEDTPLGDEVMLKVRLLPVHLSFGQHTVDFLRSFSQQEPATPSVREKQANGGGKRATEDNGVSPFFISCCDVGACKVKIDYQPRTIKVGALQHGDYLELLNLFPLEGVHLTLQKLLLTGVSGWNGVMQVLLQSWVQDITSNQLHKFIAGTTAVRPLVTVGKGMADLVLLPVEQYRRDGRVLRGLRKGTRSFLRAITVETLHTSHRVASFVARTLDDIVIQPGSRASLRGLEYYDEQPTGVLDSLEHAYDALAKEVQMAAQTIIAIPYEEQEEVMGPHGRSYVRSVARALPVAVLRPVVGASEALSCTLLGFRNYMSPLIRKEEEGRWK